MTKQWAGLVLAVILMTILHMSVHAEDSTNETSDIAAAVVETGTNETTTAASAGATNLTVTATATAQTNGMVSVTVTVATPGVTNVVVTTVTASNAVPPEPKPAWEVSTALGLTLTRGNSDTLLFTGNFLAERKKDIYELALGIDGSYGENNSIKNNETLHGFAQYNQLFGKRLFAYARVEGLHDAIADINYRFSFSPGMGYYFLKRTNTTFSVEAGPGITYEKTGNGIDTYATLRLAEKFEHRINSHVKIWESAEILPQADRWKNYVVNAEVGIESNLTKKSSLRVYLQDTYDHEPAPGRKANDVKLVTALALKF